MTTQITATLVPQGVNLVVVTNAQGAATVTVSRIQGRNSGTVRGGDRATITGGTLELVDYELLYQIPTSYLARVYNAAGTQIDRSPSSSALTVPDGTIWLRDPLRPRIAMPVDMVHKESGDHASESRNSLFKAMGRPRPIVVTDIRAGSTGTSTILTQGDLEERALYNMFNSGAVLMFTGPEEFDINWPLYISIGTVEVARISEHLDAARLHSFEWSEVDAPAAGIGGAPRTWGAYVSLGTTWGKWVSAGSTWGDVIQPVKVTTGAFP